MGNALHLPVAQVTGQVLQLLYTYACMVGGHWGLLSITCPVFEARLLHASSPKLLDVCVKEDGDLRDFAGRAPLPAWAPQVTRVLPALILLSCWVAAGADLLEEHLGEIWNLHQCLEESICINNHLREQLEHRLGSTGPRKQ